MVAAVMKVTQEVVRSQNIEVQAEILLLRQLVEKQKQNTDVQAEI